MSGQGSAISQMLPWGKSPLNVKDCVSPTGLDHSKSRETVYLDYCPDPTSVRRLEGQKRLSDCQMSQMWHTSACRVQTFWNLGSLGGWTLGSTNVKGGLHLVFDKVAQKL